MNTATTVSTGGYQQSPRTAGGKMTSSFDKPPSPTKIKASQALDSASPAGHRQQAEPPTTGVLLNDAGSIYYEADADVLSDGPSQYSTSPVNQTGNIAVGSTLPADRGLIAENKNLRKQVARLDAYIRYIQNQTSTSDGIYSSVPLDPGSGDQSSDGYYSGGGGTEESLSSFAIFGPSPTASAASTPKPQHRKLQSPTKAALQAVSASPSSPHQISPKSGSDTTVDSILKSTHEFYESKIAEIQADFQRRIKGAASQNGVLTDRLRHLQMEIDQRDRDQNDTLFKLDDATSECDRAKEELRTGKMAWEKGRIEMEERISDLISHSEAKESELSRVRDQLSIAQRERDRYENLLKSKTVAGDLHFGKAEDGALEELHGMMSLEQEMQGTMDSEDAAVLRDEIGDLRKKQKALQDDNEGLLLYINNILTRIMDCDEETLKIVFKIKE